MVISWNKENILALLTDMLFQRRHSTMDTGEKEQDPLRGLIRSGRT